jgi:hypothetical protein
VTDFFFLTVQREHLPAVSRLCGGPREVPGVENRNRGQSSKNRNPNGKGVGAAVVGSSFS